ncbi:MAG: glycosyltransferase family 2 protein [Microgenomates group bacterium]|jgi:hypothetical protein
MKLPLISVIIVTFNSTDYLAKCLSSLMKAKYPNLEIIVVDNNSTDNTIKFIKSLKQNIIPIFSDKNLGYAGGNNLGINQAKGEFVFLLNPDTLVDKNIFSFLIEPFLSDSKVAVSQPAIYLMKDSDRLNLTGKVTHYLGFDWVRDYGKKNSPEMGEIMSFSGCGVMIRKSILERTKAFDSNYFMYYEDSDLSWRLRLFGYKLIFVPYAVMFHDYKYIPVESYQPLKNKLFYNERNRLITVYKNYSMATLLLIFPAVLIIEICMLFFSLIGGWFEEKIKGYASIVKLSSSLHQNRVFVQKNRILSDKQVTAIFASTLNSKIYDNLGVKYIINPFLFCYWRIIKNLIN